MTRLNLVPTGTPCVVLATVESPSMPGGARALQEIGFVQGEEVKITARAMPGGDPMVVRVGQSTFALRGAEAACIEVQPLSASAPA